jgi:hypothetical protein
MVLNDVAETAFLDFLTFAEKLTNNLVSWIYEKFWRVASFRAAIITEIQENN